MSWRSNKHLVIFFWRVWLTRHCFRERETGRHCHLSPLSRWRFPVCNNLHRWSYGFFGVVLSPGIVCFSLQVSRRGQHKYWQRYSCFVRARRLNVIIQPHLRFVWVTNTFQIAVFHVEMFRQTTLILFYHYSLTDRFLCCQVRTPQMGWTSPAAVQHAHSTRARMDIHSPRNRPHEQAVLETVVVAYRVFYLLTWKLYYSLWCFSLWFVNVIWFMDEYLMWICVMMTWDVYDELPYFPHGDDFDISSFLSFLFWCERSYARGFFNSLLYRQTRCPGLGPSFLTGFYCSLLSFWCYLASSYFIFPLSSFFTLYKICDMRSVTLNWTGTVSLGLGVRWSLERPKGLGVWDGGLQMVQVESVDTSSLIAERFSNLFLFIFI